MEKHILIRLTSIKTLLIRWTCKQLSTLTCSHHTSQIKYIHFIIKKLQKEWKWFHLFIKNNDNNKNNILNYWSDFTFLLKTMIIIRNNILNYRSLISAHIRKCWFSAWCLLNLTNLTFLHTWNSIPRSKIFFPYKQQST
jgi:hypothetical protein